jgi:hypothetical protein
MKCLLYQIDGVEYFYSIPAPEGIPVVWGGAGEWKITVAVFRDPDIVFLVALFFGKKNAPPEKP